MTESSEDECEDIAIILVLLRPEEQAPILHLTRKRRCVASDRGLRTESFCIGASVVCKNGEALPPGVAAGNNFDLASHVGPRFGK